MLYFIAAFFVFAFIGNGFLSFFQKTNRKLILSVLENLILSFGIGLNFVIVFFYAMDIFDITSFVFVIPIPIIIGFAVKILSVPTKLKWNFETWEELKTYFKNNIQKVKMLFTKKGNVEPNLVKKDRKYNYLIWILIIASSIIILSKILLVLTSNFSQLGLDPYYWVNVIVKFRDSPSIDYSALKAESAGFVIFCGFLLYLFPSTGFYDQFAFLKMVPLSNLMLCIVILYPIQKHLFKNKSIFYVIIILLLSQQYFLFRTMVLLPSILLTTQLEIFLLMLLINGFPRPIVYFSLSSMILIHPVNAGYILIMFFGYLLLSKSLDGKKSNLDTAKEKAGIYKDLKNIIAFLIPISIWVISMTIRYNFQWYSNFTYYLGSGSILNSIFLILFTILDSLINFFYAIVSKSGWINTWGGILQLGIIFYIILIRGCFSKLKRDSLNKEKINFIYLAKFSVFVTLFIWFLPTVDYLLDPIKNVPFITAINNLLNSLIIDVYAERIFETVGPIVTIFGAIIIEEIYIAYNLKKENNIASINSKVKKGKRSRLSEKQFLSITVCCLIGINFFNFPYYDYEFHSEYTEGVVYFRQYLDANGSPGEMVGYCENNTEVQRLLVFLIKPKNSLEPIDSYVNATIVRTQYLENISCPLKYLVLIRNDDQNWEDLLVNFSGSSNFIYSNGKVILLKSA